MSGSWAVLNPKMLHPPKHINEIKSRELLAMAGILPGMRWSERWQELGFADPTTTWQDRTIHVMGLLGSCMDLESAQHPDTGLANLMQLHSLRPCVLLSKSKMAATSMFRLTKFGHRQRQQYASVVLGTVVCEVQAETRRGVVTRTERTQVLLPVHRALALAQQGFPTIDAQVAVHDPSFCISQHGWCLCSGHVSWSDQSTNCMHRELTQACARVRGVKVMAAARAWEAARVDDDRGSDVHGEEDSVPRRAAAAADIDSLAQRFEKVRITKLPVARRMRLLQGGAAHMIVARLAPAAITRPYGSTADAPKSPLQMLTRHRLEKGNYRPQDALHQPVAIVARSDMPSAIARRAIAADIREQARV
jgi:hypothetical protein